MKLEITFRKDNGDLRVNIECIDSEGYYTSEIFEKENEDGEIYYSRYIAKDFPLSSEGEQMANEWIEEEVEKIKEKVNKWRIFDLPQDRIIEF